MKTLENTKSTEYVSLINIIKILKENIIFITIITILCTGIMIEKVVYLTKPIYQASTTAVIVKGDSSVVSQKDDSTRGYTEGDISLYQKMVETYVQIAQSSTVLDDTSKELKTYTSSQLRSMVTAAPVGETQIIKLNAVSSNKEDAAIIANTYCKNFIQKSMSILPVGKIEVLDSAKIPTAPISTNKFINITLGFLIGFIVSVGIVFFRYYMDSLKIRNEKQVSDLLDILVLVSIEQEEVQ